MAIDCNCLETYFIKVENATSSSILAFIIIIIIIILGNTA